MVQNNEEKQFITSNNECEQILKLKCDKLWFITCYIVFVKRMRNKEKNNFFLSAKFTV